jgi:hypothetical protein
VLHLEAAFQNFFWVNQQAFHGSKVSTKGTTVIRQTLFSETLSSQWLLETPEVRRVSVKRIVKFYLITS